MHIDLLADKWLGAEGGADLAKAGRASRRVSEVLEGDEYATPLIATAYWQAFMHSTEADQTLRDAGFSFRTWWHRYVVRHGPPEHPRYDFLIIDHGYSGRDPRIAQAKASRRALIDGWERFFIRLRSLSGSQGGGQEFLDVRARAGIDPILAVEAQEVQPFSVIVTPPSSELLTAGAFGSPLEVRSHTNSFSTAGVLARNASGQIGVTAALHAVGTDQAKVGGEAARVVTWDNVSDSCFLSLQGLYPQPTRGLRGPLRGKLPRKYEPVRFAGCGTQVDVQTVVIGWTEELPFTHPQMQSRLLTKPCTTFGDSGAALLDADDHVLGFAFLRSGYDSVYEFSSWVWAESVFQYHKLM